MIRTYSFPLLMLLLVVMNWLALSGSRRHGQERRPGSGMDRADVIYHPIQYTPSIRDLPHITVFVHAAVGIFNKIRGKGTWGYGQQILEELLKSINDSGLLQKSNAVYIGLLGKEEDRLSAKSHIKQYSSKAQVVMEAENLYFAEFPTLWVLQNYSQAAHVDTLLLYAHTKGMRNNGGGGAEGAFDWKSYSSMPSHTWRKYMTYFLIDHHEVCIEAIRMKGYLTCGVLKQGEVYAGNFWWTTAAWIRTRTSVTMHEWTMHARMQAENMLLRGISWIDHQKHYCIHHTHHNMYECQTHRESYEKASVLPIRSDARCFFEKFNKNYMKKMTFPEYCYFANETFPEAPRRM